MESILECRTPPASPELSRLVTKRRCPFGESPQQPKIPATEAAMMARNGSSCTVDESCSDCAFELLMNGERNRHFPQPAPAFSFSLCWVCSQYGETLPCAFCEHTICEMCVRQCDRCFGVFCAFCSTINYENHEDRPLCLTCHNEELRLRRNRGATAGAVQQTENWGQGGCDGYRPLTA